MAFAELLATDPAAVQVACVAGADRIELCAALSVGGVSPGAGLLGEALRIADGRAEIVVLVRPRAGDFQIRHAGDLRSQIRDVVAAREAGAAGVAVGVLNQDGDLDRDAMALLLEAAGPIPVTLHRAIDAARDYLATAEAAMELGVARVLTSGQSRSAWEGREQIARVVRQVGNRLEVIAGAGVRGENASELLRATGAAALHASCSLASDANDQAGSEELGMGQQQRMDPQQAAAVVKAAHSAGPAA